MLKERSDTANWIVRFRRLLAGVDQETQRNPSFAMVLAKRAVRIAKAAPAQDRNEANWRSLAVLGGAMRSAERLEDARAVLYASWLALNTAGRKPLDEAELCSRLALLHRDLRQFDRAESLILRQIELADEPRAVARALLDRALVQWESGSTDLAKIAAGAREALSKLGDPPHKEDEPYYRVGIQFALVTSALDPLSDPDLLLPMLWQFFSWAPPDRECLSGAKAIWLQGLVFRRLGRFDEARESFRTARRRFVSLEHSKLSALVTVDWGILELESGNRAEVVRLAGEAFPLFRGLQLHPEALTCLALFCRAAANDTLTASMANRLRTQLERAR